MLPLVAPRAIIELSFDPVVAIGGINVRLETLGVAFAIFASLIVAALVARRTPVDTTRPPDAPGHEPGEHNHLRADDLLYIAVATLPGAVVGGRLGYALLHLDYYGSNTAALFQVGSGGFQLSLGVVGGLVTASIVAALLGAPVGRWMHALSLPLLLALAGGKAAMLLGGTGQGQPSDASWATAYAGPGPWGSLAPALPAHPAQAYEALATVVVLLVVMWFLVLDAFRGRNGGAFLLGLGLWAVARAIVASTWRDPQVAGPLGMDQVLSVVIAAVSFALLVAIGVVAVVRGRRTGETGPAGPDSQPEIAVTAASDALAWPDPESRPRI